MAAGLAASFKPGDEVVLTEMEHHSNILPWQALAKERGIKLVYVKVKEDGTLDLEHYRSLLNAKTKLVAAVYCSNTLGTVNPIDEMVIDAKKVGAQFLVDGAQSVSLVPTDVKELGCDYFCFSGHKIFAPFGIGVLYGRQEALSKLSLYQSGGSTVSKVTKEDAVFLQAPYCFEAGTPNVGGAVGIAAAIDYLEKLDFDEIHQHEKSLHKALCESIESVQGSRIVGFNKTQANIVSFYFEDMHFGDVAQILDQQNVAIRAGFHCTEPLVRRFQLQGTLRASLSIYNNFEDIEKFQKALVKAKEMLL